MSDAGVEDEDWLGAGGGASSLVGKDTDGDSIDSGKLVMSKLHMISMENRANNGRGT